ncbi:glycosyltransferase family 1 protein [Citricoccus sp. GCM10030269]|uniref:glycosyltransferase family 1 protein n=1 Tax=Citricoccus sp. GCM10030269 TaxID=3273388 RepID=UPI00360CEFE6
MSMTTYAAAVRSRIKNEGWRRAGQAVARRGLKSINEACGGDEPTLPMRPEDVYSGPALPELPALPVEQGRTAERLRIGWVCFPPSRGSGGHTTLFRMVSAMEDRGHDCTVVLYDPHSDDVSRHESTLRQSWPGLTASIASAADGLDHFDAVVASGWPTAHVVAGRHGTAVPFYFIQDYEPFFYPRGYLYGLAEASYSFGLQTIALGRMVATELEVQANVAPDLVVPFGCDIDTYRLLPDEDGERTPRRGVVYYAKRTVDRRGYLLARAALERFHEVLPDEPIHIVGDSVHGWTIPVIQHGSVPPEELNRLYNRTVASLAMSFTNVSLVPGELLAAGNVPVLNDAPGPRLDLDSPHAVWAPGTPEGLTAALATTVSVSETTIAERARRIAQDRQSSWAHTQARTAEFIESRVRFWTAARS